MSHSAVIWVTGGRSGGHRGLGQFCWKRAGANR